jgi:hypothetical protein
MEGLESSIIVRIVHAPRRLFPVPPAQATSRTPSCARRVLGSTPGRRAVRSAAGRCMQGIDERRRPLGSPALFLFLLFYGAARGAGRALLLAGC